MKIQFILAASLLMVLPSHAQTTLTLKEVQERAIEQNLKMRTSDNAIEEAKEQKKAAFTNYFPQISAVGFGMRTNKDMIQTEVKPGEILPAELAGQLPTEMLAAIPQTIPVSMFDRALIAGVTAVQPVFMGGQIVNGNKLAQVGVEVSELQKQTSSNNVSLTAEQYYWQIISLKEKQKTLDAVAELLKSYEKDADIAVKAGVGMRNDLLSVQLKQNEIESNKIKLENGLKLSKMVLAQYIGMEGQDIDVVSEIDPSVMPEYPFKEMSADSAVSSTVEYQLLQKNAEAATLQRKMEVGKNLPMIAIGAGYNYMNLGDDMDNNFGALFATVKVPISGWWGGSHDIKRKKLAEQDAKALLEDNTQMLKIRIQKNWNDVDDAYKQLALAKKSIEQSEENLRLNKDFYHAGTVTMNDLLDAEQKYQQSRDKYTEAYSTLQTKIIEYKQSIGQ